ncbi:MAG: RNA methyltransferase [Alphaproteobacteria bacterium]|nr:MAG: RNA methyltransferase [Alphaproteobacteria bacterium]
MSGYVSLWGKHAVFSVLKNRTRKINKLYCTENLLDEIKQFGNFFPIEIVTKAFLNQKLPEEVHQGVLLICSSHECCKLSLCKHLNHGDKILALDHVQDPQNVGAIIRSMAAFNFKHLLITKDRAPSLDGTVAKNACGALEYIHVLKVTNLADGLIFLKKKGFWCFGLDLQGENYRKDMVNDNCVLVVGNEGSGMRHRVKNECDFLLNLDTNVNFPVLNASVSAAIGMFMFNGRSSL